MDTDQPAGMGATGPGIGRSAGDPGAGVATLGLASAGPAGLGLLVGLLEVCIERCHVQAGSLMLGALLLPELLQLGIRVMAALRAQGVGRATELRQLGADAGGHLGYGPGGPGQAGSEEEQAGGTGGTVHVDLLVPRGFRSAGRGGGNPGRPASSRLQADQLDT